VKREPATLGASWREDTAAPMGLVKEHVSLIIRPNSLEEIQGTGDMWGQNGCLQPTKSKGRKLPRSNYLSSSVELIGNISKIEEFVNLIGLKAEVYGVCLWCGSLWCIAMDKAGA
jgi:hypothetical protein